MDSLFSAFREGMSVPSLRAKMSKILPPKDANDVPKRRELPKHVAQQSRISQNLNYNEAKHGILAMITNMYMDCHATDVTKQFKTKITNHLTFFISCITPEIPWSCVTGLEAPVLQEEATHLLCEI